MGELHQQIRQAVLEQRYLIGLHAADRLDERGVPDWQVAEGIEDGELLRERPEDTPNPAIEVKEILPDGTEIKAVWAWLSYHDVAKLVTVHYFDR